MVNYVDIMNNKEKEKAKKLIYEFDDKINSIFHHLHKGLPEDSNELPIINECAKQLALITVDEIIKSEPSEQDDSFGFGKRVLVTDYWQKVKKEIELL